jgi:GNAT acetyltransferase-like protein
MSGLLETEPRARSTPPFVNPSRTSVQAQPTSPFVEPHWDDLVRTNPRGCFFHGAAWPTVLRNTYGHTPYYFLAREGNQLVALLPVLEVSSPITGRRGVSLPFTDECPPLISGPVTAEALLQQAIEFGRSRKWRYFECRGIERSAIAAPPSISFCGHHLELAGGEDRLFADFDSSVRRAIRKAEKAGVQVEVANTLDAIQTFYALHCKTRKRHGLPPQSFLFFRQIQEHILSRGQGFVVLGRFEGRPIAAAVFFHLGSQAIYKYGASDPAFLHLRANDLVMWKAIRWHSRGGYTSLHFGRTSTGNEGLRRFKRGFGAAEDTIHYFRFDYRRNSFVTSRDRAQGGLNAVFGLLPLRLLRMMGSVMYKHLS